MADGQRGDLRLPGDRAGGDCPGPVRRQRLPGVGRPAGRRAAHAATAGGHVPVHGLGVPGGHFHGRAQHPPLFLHPRPGRGAAERRDDHHGAGVRQARDRRPGAADFRPGLRRAGRRRRAGRLPASDPVSHRLSPALGDAVAARRGARGGAPDDSRHGGGGGLPGQHAGHAGRGVLDQSRNHRVVQLRRAPDGVPAGRGRRVPVHLPAAGAVGAGGGKTP